MNDRKKLYRAFVHYTDSGASVFSHYGHVSPCGEWVDGNADTRWRLTPEWRETESEAEAALAPRIAEMGARLLQQAAGLLERARELEVTT